MELNELKSGKYTEKPIKTNPSQPLTERKHSRHPSTIRLRGREEEVQEDVLTRQLSQLQIQQKQISPPPMKKNPRAKQQTNYTNNQPSYHQSDYNSGYETSDSFFIHPKDRMESKLLSYGHMIVDPGMISRSAVQTSRVSRKREERIEDQDEDDECLEDKIKANLCGKCRLLIDIYFAKVKKR